MPSFASRVVVDRSNMLNASDIHKQPSVEQGDFSRNFSGEIDSSLPTVHLCSPRTPMALTTPSIKIEAVAIELTNALSKVTPYLMCRSDLLSSVVGGWLSTGTEHDRDRLLDQWRRPLSVPVTGQASPRQAHAGRAALRRETCPATPSPRATEPQQVLVSTPIPKKLSAQPEDKVKGLAQKLAKGTITLPKPEQADSYAQIDPLERLEKIARIALDNKDGYSNRLNLLYFAHAVESYQSSAKRGRGKNRKSQALDALSEKCHIDRKRATAIYDRKHNYLVLASTCGLGVLFTTAKVSGIENINAFSLCDYLEKQHEEYMEREKRESISLKGPGGLVYDVIGKSQLVSQFAAMAIIHDLMHSGWTKKELAESESELMALVCNYVDREALLGNILRFRDVTGDFKIERRAKDSVASRKTKRARSAKEKSANEAHLPTATYPLNCRTLQEDVDRPSSIGEQSQQTEESCYEGSSELARALQYSPMDTRLQPPRGANNDEPEGLPSYANTEPTTSSATEHLFVDRHSTVSSFVEDRRGENERERCIAGLQQGEEEENAERITDGTYGGENTHALPSHHGLVAQGAHSWETLSLGEEVQYGENLRMGEGRNESGGETLSLGYNSRSNGDNVSHAEVGSSQRVEPTEAPESAQRPTSVFINSVFPNDDQNMQSWESYYVD
ncbi:hypothetical protein PMIN03_012915 [Paraphaeosphaeria minitans]